VREGHHELRSAVARGRQAELAPEALERRVERVEAGRRGEVAAVPVARSAALLNACQMEERRGEVVGLRKLATIDLRPRLGPVRNVIA
jgi:hypothetical protein